MKQIITLFSLVVISFSCKKDSSQSVLPGITTTNATSVYNTNAVSGGTITSDGGSATTRGVCWDTNHDPTVTGNHTSDGSGTGAFSSAITGLQPSTTYYVRAYATNSAGTAYGNEISITTLDHNVYVGGAFFNGMHTIATIWKNGVATSLTDGTYDAYVYCIAVVNTDVYAGGIELNGTNWVAKVWKNGVPTVLSNGTENANAVSIFVAGSDVYLGGFDGNVARIWKNGVGTSLVGSTSISSVFVDGPDVYACGDYYSSPASYAQLWKNGVLTELTNRTLFSNANSVVVSGSDVYVGGRENFEAKVWKNGVGTSLSGGTTANIVSTLCVNGSDVYAAGFEMLTPGGISVGKYWENSSTNTTLTDGTKSALIKSIFSSGPDLYLGGIDGYEIKIWKNGTPTIIETTNSSYTIYAIYLN